MSCNVVFFFLLVDFVQGKSSGLHFIINLTVVLQQMSYTKATEYERKNTFANFSKSIQHLIDTEIYCDLSYDMDIPYCYIVIII